MADRPYVLLSAAMSADGYLDDASATRLVLSGEADLDRVDELRAGSDAILVGAQTIRADNPRLLVRSRAWRERRAAQGLPENPRRVTLTRSGHLDPAARFFAATGEPPLVYAPAAAAGELSARLGTAATVVPCEPRLAGVLADLAGRGGGRLRRHGDPLRPRPGPRPGGAPRDRAARQVLARGVPAAARSRRPRQVKAQSADGGPGGRLTASAWLPSSAPGSL